MIFNLIIKYLFWGWNVKFSLPVLELCQFKSNPVVFKIKKGPKKKNSKFKKLFSGADFDL